MTREEAIKLLVNATYSDEWQGNEDLTTAHHMAIKSLEQEPCEDAISREATLKPYNGLNDEDTISVWLIRKNIEQQPSVNPQPKTGHWKHTAMSDTIFCSCCGKYNDIRVEFSYCPNCGAKMVEPQESEVSDADSN